MSSTKWSGENPDSLSNGGNSARTASVLIHTLIYSPDGVSTAYLYKDIAIALKKAGLDVKVLSTTPHFNFVKDEIKKQPIKWKIWPFLKESEHEGIKVFHIPMKKFKSTPLRLVSFVYWHVLSFFMALFMKKRDIIISPSPPLTIGLLNVWLGKIKGSKVIYNVQEVYPDILGLKDGTVRNILSKMERYVYNNSEAVTTIDDVFYNNIAGRFRNPDKLHIIPNFVDTEIYKPEASPNPNPQEREEIRLLYAGNIGMAQDWDTLIELAKATKGEKIRFTVIGEGMKLPYLKDKVKEFNLENVDILPYQPRAKMPGIIAESDLQFIFMEPEIAAQGFPSKVYTIMACAKPLLVCSPENTPIINFLRPVGCAKLVTEKQVDKKVEDIKKWLLVMAENKKDLQEMGAKGLAEIEGKYSKEVVTRQYVDLIKCLV